MIHIVIPMAGRGSRFAKAGYEMPKPLIDIWGHYMVEYVIHNIRPSQEYQFIFLCLKEHLEKYQLREKLQEIEPNSKIVEVSEVTQGAACTVLLAAEYINNDDPMMIANSDQYVTIDIDEYLSKMEGKDGLIMTMEANDPKWSFIAYDEDKNVTLVREKEVISNEATVGIYCFSHGSDFVKYANQMIEKNIRVNNEFYVAPVYNEMIEEDKKITFYNIGSLDHGMYGLGVPEDLDKFKTHSFSKEIFR